MLYHVPKFKNICKIYKVTRMRLSKYFQSHVYLPRADIFLHHREYSLSTNHSDLHVREPFDGNLSIDHGLFIKLILLGMMYTCLLQIGSKQSIHQGEAILSEGGQLNNFCRKILLYIQVKYKILEVYNMYGIPLDSAETCRGLNQEIGLVRAGWRHSSGISLQVI